MSKFQKFITSSTETHLPAIPGSQFMLSNSFYKERSVCVREEATVVVMPVELTRVDRDLAIQQRHGITAVVILQGFSE
jgi:hypothetical protein